MAKEKKESKSELPHHYLVSWIAQREGVLAHGSIDIKRARLIRDRDDLLDLTKFVQKEVGQPTAYITAFSRFEDED